MFDFALVFHSDLGETDHSLVSLQSYMGSNLLPVHARDPRHVVRCLSERVALAQFSQSDPCKQDIGDLQCPVLLKRHLGEYASVIYCLICALRPPPPSQTYLLWSGDRSQEDPLLRVYGVPCDSRGPAPELATRSALRKVLVSPLDIQRLIRTGAITVAETKVRQCRRPPLSLIRSHSFLYFLRCPSSLFSSAAYLFSGLAILPCCAIDTQWRSSFCGVG
jgi:hypothetical protein